MLNSRQPSGGLNRVAYLVVLGVATIASGGCGGGSAREAGLVPVAGRVTLDGGEWPIPGQITFVPQGPASDAGEGASRSAVATFAKSGEFEVVGGYGEAKGLRPGEYWVAVDCPEGEPEMVDPGKPATPAKNYAPERYRDIKKSGFNVRVEDQPVKVTFDVKSK